MILTFLVGLSLTQATIIQPPRLRTILPNGACIMVEQVDGSPTVAMDLFLSAKRAPESPASHGLRHLYEHLSALGKAGTLDRRLETGGGFLRAFTLRDVTVYAVTLPPNGVRLGVAALTEMTQTQEFSTADIQKESTILAREGDLRSTDEISSAQAWQAAYGVAGLDPFGNLDIIANTSSSELSALRKALLVGDGMTVTVVGNVDLDKTTQEVSAWLSLFPKGAGDAQPSRHSSAPPSTVGVATAPDIREPFTAALLAAGLGLASECSGASFTYTVATQPGLMRISSEEENVSATLPGINGPPLFARGVSLAHRWVDRQLHEPADIAFSRGFLLSLDRGLKPELLHNRISSVTPAMFSRAVRIYQGEAPVGNLR